MSADDSHRVRQLTRNTLALVLAGGRGSRLHELTEGRAKPAVFFGGNFRIIDFPLSNCINSGIRRIGVLTQYKSHSLIQHLVDAWSFIVRALMPKYVLVLAGDQIYKMDYGALLVHHKQSGAEMTVACVGVSLEEAKSFGVMSVADDLRVLSFDEKPADPQPMPGSRDIALASMGNYVFNTDYLLRMLEADAANEMSSHDFGTDIIPSIIREGRVFAYPFLDPETGRQPYWRDVGTLDAFWEANMELVAVDPELNLYDMDWPIRTFNRQLPSVKFVFRDANRTGKALDSVVSAGCVISGSEVVDSLLFSSVRVHSYSRIEGSILLPDVEVGRNSRIRRAVIDRGCRIPPGTSIGEDSIADSERFRVSAKGIVLVTAKMLGQESAADQG
ncbi:MAG: glucose-1-phosphate adenylyltransferase [Candidatus Thiodiazotropha sp.]